MAIVTLRLARGHGIETKRRLVETLTGAITETLDIPRDQVVILIEEYAHENWARGGEFGSAPEPPTPLADLDAIFRKPAERKPDGKKAAKAPARKAPAKSRSRR